ncbi:hypothetical protein [Pseudoalteromonas rubra]|uniref:hypothetical protein n=1 Tax=Pseudoalteromonas rubra TaxID=43658 RepID=UPI0013DE50A6|nr:hypothetical protein [Pseudoalteromonas rubra]
MKLKFKKKNILNYNLNRGSIDIAKTPAIAGGVKYTQDAPCATEIGTCIVP